MKVELITLDMAGTTVTDQHEVEACFSEAAKKTGLIVEDSRILAMQGLHKYFVFETLWDEQLGSRLHPEWQMRVDKSYKVFCEVLENHYLTAPVFPTEGCPELFEYLHRKGIKIALTTGFYRKVTNIILSRLGWLEGLSADHIGSSDTLLQASITSDEVHRGRPFPDMIQKAMRLLGVIDPKKVINVGDTPSDLRSGFEANCLLSIGVTNGTHSEEALKIHNPDQLINSLFELIPVLDQIEVSP
jgi:phosphonatase-like hydrolase